MYAVSGSYRPSKKLANIYHNGTANLNILNLLRRNGKSNKNNKIRNLQELLIKEFAPHAATQMYHQSNQMPSFCLKIL